MSRQAKHVLFFAEAVTLAHVARCIALGEALNETGGFSISLAADDRFNELLGSLPFPQLPLDSISCSVFFKKLTQGLPIYNASTLARYVEEDLKILERVKPDFVIGDFRLSLAISCRIKKIPYANLTNAYWSPYVDLAYPVPEMPITKMLGVELAQKMFDYIRPFVFKLHTQAFNRVCKKFQQSLCVKDLRDMYTEADYTLYADMESLVPVKALPNNHIFIGPVLWSVKVPLPRWWQNISTEKPIIFVTLGSSGDSGLLPMLLEILSHFPVTVLCVTVTKMSLKQDYPNVFTDEFLPAEEAVKIADIVICNGGSPMVYQSIAENKFIIGLPRNLDQYLMMSLAQKAGYGVLIRSGKVDRDSIARAVAKGLEGRTTTPPGNNFRLNIDRLIGVINAST